MSAFELAAVEKWKRNSIWMQQRENSGLKEVKPTLQLVRKKIRRFLQETVVSSGEAVQSNNIKLQPTMNPVKMRTKHKMYLTFLLSSACIFLYQYQVAIPRITVFSQQSVSEVSPQVPVVEFCVCWNEFHPLSARFNELLPAKLWCRHDFDAWILHLSPFSCLKVFPTNYLIWISSRLNNKRNEIERETRTFTLMNKSQTANRIDWNANIKCTHNTARDCDNCIELEPEWILNSPYHTFSMWKSYKYLVHQ